VLRDQAHDHVGAAAGGEGHDDAHLGWWEFLRFYR